MLSTYKKETVYLGLFRGLLCHITPSLKSMDAVSLGIAKHAATLHISQSITSMLLQQTTTQHWLPEQLRYISKQAKKLMGNDDSSTGTSSADRLLAYLKKQSDVSYITLCDIPGSTLVSERGKGRPEKMLVLQRSTMTWQMRRLQMYHTQHMRTHSA